MVGNGYQRLNGRDPLTRLYAEVQLPHYQLISEARVDANRKATKNLDQVVVKVAITSRRGKKPRSISRRHA